jgi:hypothetical protein
MKIKKLGYAAVGATALGSNGRTAANITANS